MQPLNLARQPFRNERIPNILTGTLVAVAILLSIPHGLLIARVAPGRLGSLEHEVERLEQEARAARAEQGRLSDVTASEHEIEQAVLVKGLVDRRLLRWTQLLADFERALPPALKLASLAPTAEEGRIELSFTIVAQKNDANELIDLVDRLERQPMFAHVVPHSIASKDAIAEASYSMTYRPVASQNGTSSDASPERDDATATPDTSPDEATP